MTNTEKDYIDVTLRVEVSDNKKKDDNNISNLKINQQKSHSSHEYYLISIIGRSEHENEKL